MTTLDPRSMARLIDAIRGVVGDAERVALHEPTFDGVERDYVLECLDTGWVSSAGPYVDRFERDLEAATGAKHAVAVMNGTAALHVALMLAGVVPGDEVLVPSLTFVATANAVSYCGAVPHFVDASWTSLGVDAGKLDEYLSQTLERRGEVSVSRASGRVVRAVVPVHIFGHITDMAALRRVADRHALKVIDDATEALGSLYHGAPVGIGCEIGVLSFNGNKIVTTGGGGAVLLNDPELACRAKHLTTTAKVGHKWEFIHDVVGYNYRLPNLNAALGCAQLQRLPDFVRRKRRLAEIYQDVLKDFDFVEVFREPEGSQSNYWLNALILREELGDARDACIAALHERGIIARPVWRLMHELPPYAASPKMPMHVTPDIQRRLINIPSSPQLVAD